MTLPRAQTRKRTLIGLAVTAGLLSLAAWLSSEETPEQARAERTGQYVFPGLEQSIDSARIIHVQLGDTAYTLKRLEPEGSEWGMIEAGNYPVRAERLSALSYGLLDLKWGNARTTDPEKFSRIGLSDPRTGGNGAYLEIMDQDGTLISSLTTGRREDKLYGRKPDEEKAFRLIGDLPPLYTREAWLDLDIVDMLPEVIGAVRITERNGQSLYLSRRAGTGPRAFRPAPPFETDRLISRLAASGPALAISRFAPIDVKPAAALVTRPVGRHITTTHDGLEVDVSAYAEPDGFFVTLRAVEAGEGARRAETINRKAEGWAFKLTEFDWNEFTPPIRSIVRRTAPTSTP